MDKVFREVFNHNKWGCGDSRSGPGSSLEQTRIIRTEIPRLLNQLQIKSMLDIPCGDFFWMKEIQSVLDNILDVYIGGDIVPGLIRHNRQIYGTPKFRFEILDVTADRLPRCDLVMIRDCFLHLSFRHIAKALKNVQRSESFYLLASTYPKHRDNQHVVGVSIGGRALDLCAPPFLLPEPVVVINEGCTEQGGRYDDKSLGLWEVQKLNIAALTRRVCVWTARKAVKKLGSRLARVPRRTAAALYRYVSSW